MTATMDKDSIARREIYGPEDDPEILQRLHDEGLLWMVNRLVLHKVGLAIGVAGVPHPPPGDGTIPDGVTVAKLLLVASKDGHIAYSPEEDIARRNIRKLRDAGHDHLADWAERMTA